MISKTLLKNIMTIDLKGKRERANLTQQNVADILEVSRQLVSAWENGDKVLPKKREIELINLYNALM